MKARFIKSALKEEDWPSLSSSTGKTLTEVAVVGRSNVGKSSLLNHLFQSKQLVKVSSRPGKTQLLNFFVLDDCLALVDCPGYGYAKVPKKLQLEWGKYVDLYLTSRPELSLILFLLDIRRKPSEEDIQFLDWALHNGKKVRVVFTKIDKIKKQERKAQIDQLKMSLASIGKDIEAPLLFTVKNSEGRIALARYLTQHAKEVYGRTP